MSRGTVAILCAYVALAGISAAPDAQQSDITFTPEETARIVQHSPLPATPVDPTNRFASNPAAAHLGQFLFFETRFSPSNTISCATCHDPQKSFTDGRQLAKGLQTLDRHAMSLWNVAHNRWFFWDGRADSMWSQALVPLEREDEYGGDRAWAAQVVFNDADLRAAYERIFGAMPDLTDQSRFPKHAKPMPVAPSEARHAAWQGMKDDDRAVVNNIAVNIAKSIAAYEMKMVSRDAPFDRFVEGLRESDPAEIRAISDSAKRGLKIFVGRGNCRLCHSGPNFTDGEFHSVGLGPLGGGEPFDNARYGGIDFLKRSEFNAASLFNDEQRKGSEAARRLAALVNKPDNWGQFKTPSLRNVALTAPYMHQGQFATLRDVLTHYSTLKDAVQMGHHREKILVPLNLSEQEMTDLEAFLHTLTGEALPAELLQRPASPTLP